MPRQHVLPSPTDLTGFLTSRQNILTTFCKGEITPTSLIEISEKSRGDGTGRDMIGTEGRAEHSSAQQSRAGKETEWKKRKRGRGVEGREWKHREIRHLLNLLEEEVARSFSSNTESLTFFQQDQSLIDFNAHQHRGQKLGDSKERKEGGHVRIEENRPPRGCQAEAA